MRANETLWNRWEMLLCRRLATATVVVATALLAGRAAMAQETTEPEVLLKDAHNGFVVALETKLTRVDGKLANFTGLYGGWLINHQFLIGIGGYGKTTGIHERLMGYGGLILEYFVDPNRLMNFSVRGLIGGGSSSWRWDDPFFVAEPEVKMNLNMTSWFRLSLGGGYRFVGGSAWENDQLGGPTASLNVNFGRF